jgi:glutaredoxin
MTKERIESLNKLDFKWVVISITGWEERLQELATYKRQNNGSTNVPQTFPPNQPLANWVATQRSKYRLVQKGKKSTMTPEHIKSLNELDFEWNPQLWYKISERPLF